MNKFITIDGKQIGTGFPPYIIAEMSANHNSDIDKAFRIIDMAKSSGADAVKIQTYTPDTLTIDSNLPDFQITDGLWTGESLYTLYGKAFTPWEWHGPIFDYARKIGITVFSSPFDTSAVDLLEDLNVQAYKIASFEAVDLALIKYVAQTKKPLIISTGMANKEEIKEAIEVARSAGLKEIAILHCVSSYPAPSNEYNLKTLVDMQREFGVVTGLSDHTIDNITALASIALGSSIIEKHVTLDRKGGGPDDSFSLERDDLENLCSNSLKVWQSLGDVNYDRTASEEKNIKFRRSLYFVKDIEAGELITEENLRSIRPGFGLKPKFIDKVIGRRAKNKIKAATPSTWELIE
jgi:pseudaminic acid synthase